ncbi:MAG: Rrf2 family transcriptional regulator [Bacteriovoracaceae bacterium]
MRLNDKTDFCLRVLIYLQNYKGKARIQDIADFHGISKNHLSVAVNKLSELEYILSTPGPKGGIEINPAALNRTVAELVTKLETFDMVECFNSETRTCTLTPNCRLKSMLKKATKSFLKELHGYTIKDLV